MLTHFIPQYERWSLPHVAGSQKRVVAWQVFHIHGAKFEDVLPRPLSVLWSANFRVLLLFYCNKKKKTQHISLRGAGDNTDGAGCLSQD